MLGPSPLTDPPAGSRLKFLATHLRPTPADDEAYWQALDSDGRRRSVALQIHDDPRIWTLPFAKYRDYVLIPGLERLGMPPAPRPQWLEIVIDELASFLRAQDRAAHPQKPGKKGRPKPDESIKNIVFGAFTLMQIRWPGASDTALFAKTEEYLGPGVLADVVRRVVTGLRSATRARELNVAVLNLAGVGTAKLLDEIEREHPWKRSRRAQHGFRENAP